MTIRRLIDDMTPEQQAYHLTFNSTHWVPHTYFPIEDLPYQLFYARHAVRIVDQCLTLIDIDPRSPS